MIRLRAIPLWMLLLVSALLISSQSAGAQGTYLERGTSGLGLSAGYQTNEFANGYMFSIGGSANAMFDLGLNIGRLSWDDNAVGDLKSTSIEPFLTVHAIKQSETVPLSLALSGGYRWDSYSSDALSDLNVDMNGTAWSLGGSIYRSFPVSPNVNLIPNAGVSYSDAEITMKDDTGESVSASGGVTTFSFAMGFSYTLAGSQQFIVNPQISKDEDTTTFSVDVGFILPAAGLGLGM